jgi:hypothetical protein
MPGRARAQKEMKIAHRGAEVEIKAKCQRLNKKHFRLMPYAYIFTLTSKRLILIINEKTLLQTYESSDNF